MPSSKKHARNSLSLLTLFLIFLFHCSNALAAHQNLRFAPIDSIEIEKTGIQEAITQDEQGFMWFGGANGLARYDGHSVKVYTHNPNDPSSLSHNYIRDLLTDSRGRLWVATGYGVNLYDKSIDGFVRFYRTNQASDGEANDFRSLLEGANGHLWLASGSGLAKLNLTTYEFEDLPTKPENVVDINATSLWSMAQSELGFLWLGFGTKGLMKYSPNSGDLVFPQDSSGKTKGDTIFGIVEESERKVWLATENRGLLRLDSISGEVKQYKNDFNDPKSLAHNTVWELFFDQDKNFWVAADDSLEIYDPKTDGFVHYRQLPGTNWSGKVRSVFQSDNGDLWFGLFPSGIAKLDVDATVFKNYQHEPTDNQSISNSAITAIVEDKLGNFWVGTENGLNYFDRKTQTFKRFHQNQNDPHSLPSNAVLSLLIDRYDTLWVGTWKGGWARYNAELDRFETPFVVGDYSDHLDGQIWTIYEDKQGTLWAGGMYRFDRANDRWMHYKDYYPEGDALSNTYVRDAYEDSKGQFWLATGFGLDLFDRETGKIKRFKTARNQKNSISDDAVVVITEDSDGRLLIGTSNGGINIYNPKNMGFSPLAASNDLPGGSIVGIADDGQGNIWMTSGSGLIRYDKSTREYQLFDRKNGLTGDLFHRTALLVSSRGEVVFGGANGLTILQPDDLTHNPIVPPVVITDLEVLNVTATMSSHPEILQQPINLAREITLKHDQNVFTLHYSALNYRLPKLNQFSYKLEGFDSDWMPVGNMRRVTYTNLDPGDYIFRVKGANNSGLWNEKGAQLKIRIQPPWWKTPEAYFSYVLIILFILTLAFMVFSRLREAKNERLVNQQLRQVDHLKDAFMANTSHELRTPLNGIIGLTEWVISEASETLTDEAKKRLHLVVNSGKRLSNIVNDILDFSKLKSHEISLQKSQVNLHELVESTLDVSEALAKDKGLVLINDIDKAFPPLYADEQRLSQVLYNLVGNAIKFTPLGEVRVSAKCLGKDVEISVADTGIGISPDDAKRIFLPFEQSLIKSEGKSVGTGLGLAVSKQLIELHGGRVSLQSQVGKGSVFSIRIPIKAEAGAVVKQSELSFSHLKQSPKVSVLQNPVKAQASIATMEDQRIKQAKILVVDDEPVNRMVLDGFLRLKFCNITECANGMEALNLIKSGEHFDIVLLDVMMPGMSGYEVCREIRKTYNELELPVVFLTAKSQTEDLNEGYDSGANDFLFKPVSKEEFLMKVNLHLKSKNIYRSISNPSQSTLNNRLSGL